MNREHFDSVYRVIGIDRNDVKGNVSWQIFNHKNETTSSIGYVEWDLFDAALEHAKSILRDRPNMLVGIQQRKTTITETWGPVER